jgi:serine/threonine-protein kinase
VVRSGTVLAGRYRLDQRIGSGGMGEVWRAGESLAHTLSRTGRLTAQATMRLVAEAAEALHAAHEKGVTHRDVKPGNLLLRPDGSAVLTDFGIARSAGSAGHTTTGSMVGTAGYIAPERATGYPATPASGIYSLGPPAQADWVCVTTPAA